MFSGRVHLSLLKYACAKANPLPSDAFLIFDLDNSKKQLAWIIYSILQMQTSPVFQTLHCHLLLTTTLKDKVP